MYFLFGFGMVFVVRTLIMTTKTVLITLEGPGKALNPKPSNCGKPSPPPGLIRGCSVFIIGTPPSITLTFGARVFGYYWFRQAGLITRPSSLCDFCQGVSRVARSFRKLGRLESRQQTQSLNPELPEAHAPQNLNPEP